MDFGRPGASEKGCLSGREGLNIDCRRQQIRARIPCGGQDFRSN
jgi:hypothetical protein